MLVFVLAVKCNFLVTMCSGNENKSYFVILLVLSALRELACNLIYNGPTSRSVFNAGCDNHMHSSSVMLSGYLTKSWEKRSSSMFIQAWNAFMLAELNNKWFLFIGVDILISHIYFLLDLNIHPVIRYLCLQKKWIRDDLAIRRLEFQMYMCVFVFMFKIILCWNILVCVQEPWGIISDGLGVIHDSI